MYEYRDSDGELVTVRSLRTLERLLANAVIREETPFRAGGEGSFVPACSHPLVERLAAQMAMPFAPQPAAEVPPTPAHTINADLPKPPALPQKSLKELTVAPVGPEPLVRPRPRTSLEARPASPWQTSAAPRTLERPVAAPKGVSAFSTMLLALVWQGGALLAGLLAYAVAGGTSNSGIGIFAALVVTGAIARTGGVQLRKRDPFGRSTPLWVAAVIFVGALSLNEPGGAVMALVTAVALGYGWRGAGKVQR